LSTLDATARVFTTASGSSALDDSSSSISGGTIAVAEVLVHVGTAASMAAAFATTSGAVDVDTAPIATAANARAVASMILSSALKDTSLVATTKRKRRYGAILIAA
jgi:hypothetical protein